jgi:type VI secretion system secreted protein VgrG
MIGGGFITIDGKRVDDHDIVSVVVLQELNAHWWCEIECRDSPDRRIPAEDRLGNDLVVIGIAADGSQVLVFSGFVLESELIYETSGSHRGHLRGVSWSYLMDLTPRREYYYQQTPDDVAKKLAANNDLGLDGELDGPKLSYVQMGETDFHFLLRLVDESEKWLRPTEDGIQIQGKFQPGGKLEWRSEHGLRHFSVKGQMSHPSSAGTHYDYRKMQSKVVRQVKDQPEFYSSSSRMVEAVKSSSAGLADFAGERNRLLPVEDLQQRLKKETRRSLGSGVTCWGASLRQTLKPGDEGEISGVLDAQGTYGLIRVVHHWTDKGYENHFVCTPWKKYTSPHPPASARHDGIVAARVTDNNDPENLGRLQVQYYWQETSHTCWLRLMTPHAGAGRGFMFLPEIGDEVWIMFEEGDPERARIIGSGWNGVHKLPREEFWGGDVKPNDVKRIVTKSGHRITIVDKPGKNSMVLATPNHLKISMIENSDETGDAMLALHSDGDIVLSAPNGRIHLGSAMQSKDVESSIPVASIADQSITSLDCTTKLEKAIATANIPQALLSELGGSRGIAAALATMAATFIVLQFTPVGWAGDIAAGLIAIGIVTSGSEIINGVKALYDCWQIACKEAKTNADLRRAGAAFGQAVAKIGINSILLILNVKGAKRLMRANEVANAYKQHPQITEKELPSYVAGSDLGADITHPTLLPGDEFEMWVRDGGEPGIHAVPPETDPNSIGIELEGRHLETFRVTEPLQVTQSTAADFPSGQVPGVGGTGGGTQYILPPGWQGSVEKVGP